MRTNIDSVVADVKRSFEARDWALEYAKREGLLIPYLKRGKYNSGPDPLMEDEATDDPYGCLWEVDVESDAESDGKHLDFDTMDWTNAPTAKQDYEERLAKAPHHCHGDSEPSGGTSSQDVAVLAHMDKMQSYMEPGHIVNAMPNSESASMGVTLERLMAKERIRYYHTAHRGDICNAMRGGRRR